MSTEREDHRDAASRRHPQFLLRHIFRLVLVISLFLALVTQLKHIGLVLFCFVAAVLGGMVVHPKITRS